jgi:hypothetical protein
VRRHRTDIAALLFGLAFVIYSGTFIASELSDTDIEAAWISAIAFVTLGVVALTATLLRGGTPADRAMRGSEAPPESASESALEEADDVGEG